MTIGARSEAKRGTSVVVVARPLWRVRLARELARYLLGALSIAGVAASARFLVAPPRAIAPAPVRYVASHRDVAAEAYATLFARRYLTWNAAEPLASTRSLQPFVGSAMEADAGLVLPASGQQRVEWVEVVQERLPEAGEHVYTLAAQTDPEGLVYLTVSVIRTPGGALAIGGYPAFVGPPAARPAQGAARLPEVSDPNLVTVVQRAVRNYLAGSGGDLAADLTDGAQISLPAWPLRLESVQRLDWTARDTSVLAVVQAADSRGARYTLAYELDVARRQGRWEVSAVQTDPDV